MKKLPSQDRLKELLSYDLMTGVFRWKIHRSSSARIGSDAGKVKDGYLKIGVDGECFFAHRLAFVFVDGFCPPQVDHRNGDRLDNSWNNLRAASNAQNSRNAKRRKDNVSGDKNIYWLSQARRWQVNIQANDVRKRLNFRTLDDARRFAEILRKELHGEFARAA